MSKFIRVPTRDRLSSVWHVPDVLAIAFAIVLLLVGMSLLVELFGISSENLVSDFGAWAILLTAISFCVPVFLAGWYRKVDWKALGWRPLAPLEILFDIGVGVLVIPVIGLLAQGVVFLRGEAFENPQLDIILPEGITTGEMVILAFLIGIVTPFAEEWLFRAVLHRWLRQYLRFGGAVLLSSLVFGLLHGALPLVVATAGLGFVCAWAYERSGSLWSAIIIHIVNNLVQVVGLYILFSSGLPL